MNERESLDASEPIEQVSARCPLCGEKVGPPFEPGGLVQCWGCGAHVRGVPYLAATSISTSGEGGESTTGPSRTTWEGCCTPYAPAAPSGVYLRHSMRCSSYAGQRLSPGELEGWRDLIRVMSGKPETISTTTVNMSVVAIRYDEAYIDAHIDDDDDR